MTQVVLAITVAVQVSEQVILSGMDKDVDHLTLVVQFQVAVTRVHHGSSNTCLPTPMTM